MKRITMLLFILIIGGVVLCSNNSGKKIHRTTVALTGLPMHLDNSIENLVNPIMHIPFKSKVEIIDNKSIEGYVKIKYKDTVGYVHKGYLSERDDVPFIDDIKYNLPIHEFDYDKMTAIKALKQYMLTDKFYKNESFYYYTDDPQIFSLYGKDCDGVAIKVIAIIMNSKINVLYSRMICFKVKNNKFIPYSDSSVESQGKLLIESYLEYQIRNPQDCNI